MQTTAFASAAVVIFLIAVISPTISLADVSDASAMWDIASSLTGLPKTWQKGTDPCSPKWDLISCAAGRVVSLNLADRSLSGTLPYSINSISSLQAIHLQRNSISGPLPSLAGLSNLQQAFFDFNLFSSVPPNFLSGLSSLQSISLDSNPLASWSIPDGLADSVGLVAFSAANDTVSGEIPSFFGKLSGLQQLSLANNNLTGQIPASLAGLLKLQVLDVSRNGLWGTLPSFGPGVTVRTNGNPLIGKNPPPGTPSGSPIVPSGALPSPPAVISPPPTDSRGSTSSFPSPRNGTGSGSGIVIGATLAAIVVLGALLGFLFLRIRKQRRRSRRIAQAQGWLSKDPQPLKKLGIVSDSSAESDLATRNTAAVSGGEFSPSTRQMIPLAVLRTATDDFHESNILGKGGFGVVYRGDLNGIPVAVKRSTEMDGGVKGREEFRAEIEVFQKVKHRHLVSLLGYCAEGNERLLVYEFMAEGTLGQHLFDKEKYSPLDWRQRLVIALDVARGVEYLHSMTQEIFIHRDLKPSNILLDKNLRAKVSDFGLVKLVDGDRSMMTRLAGTFGYLAPEYAILGKVTTKVDVYAYGVILMEMLMGRKALDESLPEEETHLVSKFFKCLLHKDSFLNNVDKSLDLDDEACSSIFKVAELAAHCTAREPNQRPEIGHAVTVLAPMVDRWKPESDGAASVGGGGGFYDDELYGGGSRMRLSERLERWRFDDGTSTMDLLSSRDGS